MEMWVGVVMGLEWAAQLVVPTMWAFMNWARQTLLKPFLGVTG